MDGKEFQEERKDVRASDGSVRADTNSRDQAELGARRKPADEQSRNKRRLSVETGQADARRANPRSQSGAQRINPAARNNEHSNAQRREHALMKNGEGKQSTPAAGRGQMALPVDPAHNRGPGPMIIGGSALWSRNTAVLNGSAMKRKP